MEASKVSIIIPVYRTAAYIERCAKSLFEQTLDDIEFIFINDCTDDNSISILNDVLLAYPNRKKCVRILDMEKNSGIAAVRQYGISLAKGDYIIHCDSDDWIERDMVESMYNVAVTRESHIVVCDYIEDINGTTYYRKGKSSQNSDLASDVLLLYASLCTKLVKRDIVFNTRIHHPAADCGEDLALSFQYAQISKQVTYIEKPFYHYCRNSNSILGVRTDESILSRQAALLKNFEIVIKSVPELSTEKQYQDQIVHLGLYIKNLLLPLLSHNNQYRKLWLSSCPQINNSIIKSKSITFREKINSIIVRSGLYPVYAHLFKKA